VAGNASGDIPPLSRLRAQHAILAPWVPLLAADYRVLWFDARGCGETTKPPPGSRMSFSQLAGDAVGLMDKLGIERVHWVGESSGGSSA